MYKDIKDLLKFDEIFAKDLYKGICNGFIFSSIKNNIILKNYLLLILYNFHKELYFKENDMGSLEISGPLCFAKFIENNNPQIKLFYKILDNDDWKKSVFIDESENIIIKISYQNYYNENNYLNTTHYGILWQQNKIYNNIINYQKINYISGIA